MCRKAQCRPSDSGSPCFHHSGPRPANPSSPSPWREWPCTVFKVPHELLRVPRGTCSHPYLLPSPCRANPSQSRTCFPALLPPACLPERSLRHRLFIGEAPLTFRRTSQIITSHPVSYFPYIKINAINLSVSEHGSAFSGSAPHPSCQRPVPSLGCALCVTDNEAPFCGPMAPSPTQLSLCQPVRLPQ